MLISTKPLKFVFEYETFRARARMQPPYHAHPRLESAWYVRLCELGMRIRIAARYFFLRASGASTRTKKTTQVHKDRDPTPVRLRSRATQERNSRLTALALV